MTALVVGLHAWVAWRASRLPLGQDEGLWLLWPFTGSRPYIDHVDCKPPGIQLWLWGVRRLAGDDVPRVVFVHHFLLAAFPVVALWITGRPAVAGLVSLFLISPWLYAHHAWSEPLSTGLLLVGVLLPPAWGLPWLAMAVLTNSKLWAPLLVYLALGGAWGPTIALLVLPGLGLLAVRLAHPPLARGLWYGCVVVARRMVEARRLTLGWRGLWGTPRDRPGAVLAVVALGLAGGEVELASAGALVTYLVVNASGRIWRANHWIPMVAFVATGAPDVIGLLLLADALSHRFLLGDVDRQERPGASAAMHQARRVGQFLRGRAGPLWVDGLFTQIYVYARKPPAHPWVEQVELRDAVAERRNGCVLAPHEAERLRVIGPWRRQGLPRRYRTIFVEGPFTVIELDPASRGSP